MVSSCVIVCRICGAYIDTGENWHRRRKFQSCDRCQNSGGRVYGMGNGVFDGYAKRYYEYQQKELDFSDIIRAGHRGIMAVLL